MTLERAISVELGGRVLIRVGLREDRRKIGDIKIIQPFTTQGNKEMGWLTEKAGGIKEVFVSFCFKVELTSEG